MTNNKKNNGQIAIIVLLASAIVLTLGLSASKITTTETKIETDEESLKEAFNTAESAINNYLNDSSKKDYTVSGGEASIVSTSIGNADSISSGGKVFQGNKQLFWLVNHDNNGDIGSTFYSGGSVRITVDSGFSGALKIDYFSKNGSNYSVSRSGYNFRSSTLVAGYTSISNDYIDLTLTDSPLLLSVTPIGNSTKITISGSSNFPVQGEDITSNSSTDDGVKTQIKTKYIYDFPAFMLDAITAQGNIE